MMKRIPGAFNNESAETRGTELEKAYAKILRGRIVGGNGDGGVDLVFDDVPEMPIAQVKSTLPIAQKFLTESIRKLEFIPMLVGDPGQYTAEQIFESLIEHGGFAGIDVPNREKVIENIQKVRDYILSHNGRQKGLPGDDRRGVDLEL